MSSGNLIANGNFATGDFTDWTLGGHTTKPTSQPKPKVPAPMRSALIRQEQTPP